MKYSVARLLISILFIVFLVGPAAVSGSTIPDVSEHEIAIPLEIQPVDTTPTASPPVIVSDASIRSTSAVFIDEQNPVAKHNGLPYSAHLRVGISPEFGGEMWTLISFSPIEESDGGPVPDDAVIRGAKLRLYKESGDAGTVKVYRLTESFNENTVTWDTQPGKWATAEGTKSVPAANGWVEIDIKELSENPHKRCIRDNYNFSIYIVIR